MARTRTIGGDFVALFLPVDIYDRVILTSVVMIFVLSFQETAEDR
jgi:hypothetical protein